MNRAPAVGIKNNVVNLMGRFAMMTGKDTPLMKRFLKDRSGNFAIAFGFCTVAIFLAIGLAVDFSRSMGEKTRINNALDAASLATARALSIGEVSETGNAAENYFKAVFAANMGIDSLAGSDYTIKNFNIDPVDQSVTAVAEYDQELTFTRVGTNQSTRTVASKSAAVYGIGDIEVAMVLDVTGSMSGSKIEALKDAAKLGVTELLAPNTADDTHVRISLVPYSDSINAGPLSKYVYPDYNQAKSNAPVYDPSYKAGYNVEPFLESYGADCWMKSNGHFKCVDIPNDFVVKANGKPQDKCATDRKAPFSGPSYQYTDANPSQGMISRDSRLPKNGCTSSKLITLTDKKSKLNSAINGLSTGGCTAGHIGLQWAWYTISHNWADYHSKDSKPDDFATNDKLAKYIILMTDGAFNTAYAGSNDDDVECSEGTLSVAHTAQLCTNIKASGIKIFTIGFATSNSADAMLQACASPDEGTLTYAYEPNTAAELEDTYSHIANLIQSLRLTQ